MNAARDRQLPRHRRSSARANGLTEGVDLEFPSRDAFTDLTGQSWNALDRFIDELRAIPDNASNADGMTRWFAEQDLILLDEVAKFSRHIGDVALSTARSRERSNTPSGGPAERLDAMSRDAGRPSLVVIGSMRFLCGRQWLRAACRMYAAAWGFNPLI